MQSIKRGKMSSRRPPYPYPDNAEAIFRHMLLGEALPVFEADPVDELVPTLKGMSADAKRTEIIEAYLYALPQLTGKQVGKMLVTFREGPERLATLRLLITNQKLQKEIDFDSIMNGMYNDTLKIMTVILFKEHNLLPKGTTALNLQKHFFNDSVKVELFKMFIPKSSDPPPAYDTL